MILSNDPTVLFVEYMKENQYSFNTHGVPPIYKYLQTHQLKKLSQLDRVFDNFKNSKENTYRILIGFYRYLEHKYSITIDSQLYDCNPIDNVYQRRLDLIKRMQTITDIDALAHYYLVDAQTIRRDIETISSSLNDTQFENNNMLHNTTYHPLEFIYTMDEVVFLTYGLLNISHTNELYKDVIAHIISDTYLQLSDYAKEKLHALMTAQDIENLCPKTKPIYSDIIYYMKTQDTVCIDYLDSNQYIQYKDVIITSYNNKDCITIVDTNNHNSNLYIKNIISIKSNN